MVAGPDSDIKPGNALPYKSIPVGSFIHNIEMKMGKGGQLARTAGAYAQLMAKEEATPHLKFPSNEVRLVLQDCYANGRPGRATSTMRTLP